MADLPQAVEEQETLANELMAPPPDTTNVPEPAPEEPTPKKEPIDRTDYKGRYVELRAHRERDLVESQTRNNELQAKLVAQAREKEALNRQFEELKSSKEGLPKDLLTEEERMLLGEDAMPVVSKVAQAIAERRYAPMQEQIRVLNEQIQQLGKVQHNRDVEQRAKTAGEIFSERVMKAMPGVREIDKKPEFRSWLNEIDQLSGLTHRELARRAQAAGDVGRVASLYSDWESAHGGAAAPDPKVSNVMPGQAADTTPNVGSAIVWNEAKVSKFYDDVRRGRYTDKKAAALERDLFAAKSEGRYM